MSQGGVRAELQPDVHTKLGDGIDCRRELDRLPDSASPMRSVARIPVETVAGDGAKERNFFGLRRQVGKRIFKCVRSRLHHRVMERMIDPDKSCEDALRLEVGEDGFDGMTWASKGERPWAVERRD